jgi:7,8-dihydropterin-6-yl-methyl-4-(beta-D-ribofuranosyl)aminobenzene 5'-phosphate synthase
MRIHHDPVVVLNSHGLRLSIVFDNYLYHPHMKPLWGFSCFIELFEQTLLFDTGSNGRVLLQNMRKMELDPASVDQLFLSHPHWDHIGGLDSVIEVAPLVEIVAPDSLSKLLIGDLRGAVRNVRVIDEKPAKIGANLYSTGVMGEIGEQSLVIDMGEGLVVLTGCAHPGIDRIAARAREMLNKEILLLMGGFHLSHSGRDAVDGVIESLKGLGVRALCPTHCTGELAREMFADSFGEACLEGGAGRIVGLA